MGCLRLIREAQKLIEDVKVTSGGTLNNLYPFLFYNRSPMVESKLQRYVLQARSYDTAHD